MVALTLCSAFEGEGQRLLNLHEQGADQSQPNSKFFHAGRRCEIDRVEPSAGVRDVVFNFSLETLADAQKREFCRPPDQALLALIGAKSKVGRVAVANPWRSASTEALRLRLVRNREQTKVLGFDSH